MQKGISSGLHRISNVLEVRDLVYSQEVLGVLHSTGRLAGQDVSKLTFGAS